MQLTTLQKIDIRMSITTREQLVIEMISIINDEVTKAQYENELRRLHELKKLF